jgi:acetyl-CoA acetyltransferase
MLCRFEDEVVLSGIGQSQVGRKLNRSALDLTLEACTAALADAGLRPDGIDGLSAWPGDVYFSAGFAGAGLAQVQDALRIRTNWHSAGPETPGQLGAVVNAMLAVAAGLCRHVLVYRTVVESSAQGERTRRSAQRRPRQAAVLPRVTGALRSGVLGVVERAVRVALHARVRADPGAVGPGGDHAEV